MMNELVRAADVNLDDIQRMAKMMVVSGYFDAAKDVTQGIAQLAVKILAGRELGYGPFASAQGIHVIQGKPTLSANLMAAAVKNHPHYDYKVRKMSNDGVSIEFFEDGQSLGTSEFTAQDAQTAGLTGKEMYKKFARNMLFARALSNGVRWYCPDVFNGSTVYVPEELGATVDMDTGEIIEAPAQSANPQIDEVDFGMASQPEDNPFHAENAGADAAAVLPYGDIADSLTGTCRKLADWAADLHANGNGPASNQQYKFLAGTVDQLTGGAHTVVLSVLCRRPVSAENPCSGNLASKLLDVIQKTTPRKDANGKSIKGSDGKIIYDSNPKYRLDVVDCLASIAQTVAAWRQNQPVTA